jgi:hypothetical protein
MTPDSVLPRLAAFSCVEIYIGYVSLPASILNLINIYCLAAVRRPRVCTRPPSCVDVYISTSMLHCLRRSPRGACRRRRCNWARARVEPLRSCSMLGRQRVDVVRADPA